MQAEVVPEPWSEKLADIEQLWSIIVWHKLYENTYELWQDIEFEGPLWRAGSWINPPVMRIITQDLGMDLRHDGERVSSEEENFDWIVE